MGKMKSIFSYTEDLYPWELADKLEQDAEEAEAYAEYLFEQQRDREVEEWFDNKDKS